MFRSEQPIFVSAFSDEIYIQIIRVCASVCEITKLQSYVAFN